VPIKEIMMTKYIFKRFVQLLIVLFIVSALIFFLVRITPTDPIASIARGKQMSKETREALMVEYNLDKSMPEQYITWLTGIIKGEFGKSYTYREDVFKLLGGRLSTTIQLVIMSSIIIVFLGIPLGILSASKMNSTLDQTLNVISVLLVSSPPFFTGMLLMLMFTMIIPVFPTFGTGEGIIDNIRYLTLPAISLASVRLALTQRITRSNMVENLTQNYIETAVAKGLSHNKVVYKHALRNSIIPILTVTSLQICGMLGGSVMVETVFSLNGVGTLLVNAINKADYPLTQIIILFMVGVFLITNFIVDILYVFIDPRIKLGKG